MSTPTMMVLVACVCCAAGFLDLRNSAVGLSERHHRSHDTYTVPRTMTTTLVVVIAFMGVLGILVSWLCMLGVFAARSDVVLGFFLAFVVVMFVVWALMSRYRVVTYEDHLIVVPFFGLERTVDYSRITRMIWVSPITNGGQRSVRIYAEGTKGYALIWHALDIERILMRIDRYDVLEGPWA